MAHTAASLEKVLKNGRNNLLMMMILTLVNAVLYFTEISLSFPFSATIPQFIWGYSLGFLNNPGDMPFFIIGIMIAVISLGIYLPFYFLSKKHPVLLLVPIILFVIDTCFLIWLTAMSYEASMLIDVAFHFWVLFYLVYGVYAAFKIRHLPPEVFETPQYAPFVICPDINADVPVSFEEQMIMESAVPETTEIAPDVSNNA